MPEKKDMGISGMKDGDMSPMSHTPMDQPTEPLNDQLAGMTPFPQPGPRTTRVIPPPSQTMARPSETREGEVPLHLGPEVVMVAMNTSPRLHDPPDGLDGNGRPVLPHPDLRALYRLHPARTPPP